MKNGLHHPSSEGTMMKLQRISALLAALMMAVPLVSMADD